MCTIGTRLRAAKMKKKRPTSIAEYIDAAPSDGKAHLNLLYSILKSVAPTAEETIKWGAPFFVEPRFLFAFTAHKNHVGFMASLQALEPYRAKLQGYEITERGILKIPYSKPVPQKLVREIAKTNLRLVKDRDDDGFWQMGSRT
jgi:uncharacterized protein YdhG (YjbR/CyaY superfamily)